MTEKLLLAVPSKGRLMEQTIEMFAKAGLTLRKTGNERGYRGEIAGLDTVEVAFISASEIAWYLKTGRAHMGVTGEDLIREQISDADERVTFLKPLGFGHADVVVAVPDYWIDVRSMAELDEIAATFRREHGRWFRVATKYINTTRRFFAAKGVIDYRIIESLGATEGAPAAGTADLIV
ncbi:MAG TPA: ATP phosphoribosyltransferase, partial [Hyphomicrobium sp.]|nr:ATP phosphoribosyltransferase [Hyphomicrobium sp.]